MREVQLRLARRWRTVFLWALFGVGVLLQALGPHLQVKNNRFILPPSLISSGSQVRPDQIVARERAVQLLSGILTLGGALGLALRYGKALFGGRSPQSGLASESNTGSTRLSNREVI